MYLLILFFPFLSFLCLSMLGRFIGKNGSIILAISFMGFSVIGACFSFVEVGFYGYICNIDMAGWCHILNMYLNWNFFFDILTVIMLFVVTFISFLVHLYSLSYMENDPHFIRFLSYLSLFTFFMLILVTAGNYVQLFIGWEGVGLCSYLLVNFWHTREQANKSAMKAIIVNRVGDFFFLLALLLIFFCFKTFDFVIINSVVSEFSFFTFVCSNNILNLLNFISFFLFLAAVGKSAQLGLHTWLPDAMEGPTPVSALIHAATMVTAGVFLLLRSTYILEFSEITLAFITIFGSLTAIFASTTGLFQNDLKKVIAYSTCSQLGYMFFACGCSNYAVAMFHLYNHAFFKALLFLGAGVVIHALNDEQDMRKMGGLFNLLPFTFIIMLVGSISLAGFPFLTGFFSKDIILEITCNKYNFDSIFAYTLAAIAAFFTAFYSFRLLVLTFLVNFKGTKNVLFAVHEGVFFLSFPLFILSFFSIFIGFLSKDLFLGFGSSFWLNSFCFSNFFLESSEFLPNYIKIMPFILSVLGIFFSVFCYTYSLTFYLNIFFLKETFFYVFLKNVYVFFSKKWFVDMLYNKIIVNMFLFLGYEHTFKIIDRGLLEILGPLGFVRILFFLGNDLIRKQTGFIYQYFLFSFLGIFVFFSCLFFFFYNLEIDFSFFIFFFLIILLKITIKDSVISSSKTIYDKILAVKVYIVYILLQKIMNMAVLPRGKFIRYNNQNSN